MRFYFLFFFITLLALVISTSRSTSIVNSQESKQRTFFIELQPDSPLLIRDFSAKILSKDKYSSSPKMEVIYFVENRSKKHIKRYSYQNPAEDDVNYQDYEERGDGGDLLPGESHRRKSTMTVEGESLVYRIKEVEFEDGTKWKAKPFNARKAKKSARIIASTQKMRDRKSEELTTKRTVAREGWTSPIFADRVTKVLRGAPRIIEGITVQTKLHELKLERLDMVESCEIQNDSSEIAFIEFDYEVEKFTSYEVKGRVFAYEVDYALINAEDGYDIGARIGGFYVDEEGDGYFKLLCEDNSELRSLPEWVKNLAAK